MGRGPVSSCTGDSGRMGSEMVALAQWGGGKDRRDRAALLSPEWQMPGLGWSIGGGGHMDAATVQRLPVQVPSCGAGPCPPVSCLQLRAHTCPPTCLPALP